VINLINKDIVEKIEISKILGFLNNIDNDLLLLEKDINYLYKNVVKNKSILINVNLNDSFKKLSESLNKSSNSMSSKLYSSMSNFGMSLSAASAAISINPYFANAIRQAQKAE
jgi:hypothetical protein